MKKSGLADSPFFNPPPQPTETLATMPPSHPHTVLPSHRDTTLDTKPPRYPDTTPVTLSPSHRDTIPIYENILQVVRRAVKQFGKEAATHRFTPEEKRAVNEIVYQYRQQGIKTNENEITRLALNYFLADYQREGENSLLAKLVRDLNT